jgi:hypothetical protein
MISSNNYKEDLTHQTLPWTRLILQNVLSLSYINSCIHTWSVCRCFTRRILTVMKVETDIITTITGESSRTTSDTCDILCWDLINWRQLLLSVTSLYVLRSNDRWFSVSESVGWYWQYQMEKSMNYW